MRYQGAVFKGLKVLSAQTFDGYELEKCTFDNCVLAPREGRGLVRNVSATETTLLSSRARYTVFEDCHIDGLKTGGVEFIWSCVFKRVTLKGRVGKLILRNDDDDDGAWIDDAYHGVDWALDITEARVQTLDIHNVPPSLVRRDRETQILIRRQDVEDSDWQPRTLGVTGVAIENMLRVNSESRVVVAPKANKKLFEKMMAEFAEARAMGLVAD